MSVWAFYNIYIYIYCNFNHLLMCENLYMFTMKLMYQWWFLQVLIESIICMYMYRYLFILLCLVWYCFNPKMAKVFHLENLLVFMKQTEKLIQTPDTCIMVVPEDICSSCIVLIFLLFHYLILSLMWLLALYVSFSHSINTLFSGI